MGLTSLQGSVSGQSPLTGVARELLAQVHLSSRQSRGCRAMLDVPPVFPIGKKESVMLQV